MSCSQSGWNSSFGSSMIVSRPLLSSPSLVASVELFLQGYICLCFTVVSSFPVNLAGRRDASFFLCGEVSRLIHRLALRCYSSETVPLENDWFQLFSFKPEDGTYMSKDEFLIRLKLHNKVSVASKQKADGIHSGKKADKATISKTCDKVREDFAQYGLTYVSYLLGEILQQSGLRSDLVKGMAAFDPVILLKRPLETALKHFNLLYQVFSLNLWVSVENEDACRDEYLELRDYLRATYPASFDVTSSGDLIDFLLGLDFLQSRQHLLYLFKLCCLCVTGPGDVFPAVILGQIDTSNYRGRLTDVILPSQSFVSNVPDSISYCSSDSSLLKFSQLSADFGRKAFMENYDPWIEMDLFGRASIYKSLLASYKSMLAGPAATVQQPDSDGNSTVVDAAAVNVPSRLQRKRQFASGPGSGSSSVVEEPTEGSSKN